MSDTTDRGRQASRPGEIPKSGWRDILLRVKSEIAKDHVSISAAGVAFFGLLAIFPAIAALIGIAGLVLDPAEVDARLSEAAGMLPQDAAAILQDQEGAYVFGLGDGNKAQIRRVTLGQRVGTGWAVTAGLAQGEVVIVSGIQKVQAGVAVTPQPAGN